MISMISMISMICDDLGLLLRTLDEALEDRRRYHDYQARLTTE